jgi:hypothetical protein|eukprot:SAG25_NODE_518_length_7263_cov_5.751535_8_plen_162_part_00
MRCWALRWADSWVAPLPRARRCAVHCGVATAPSQPWCEPPSVLCRQKPFVSFKAGMVNKSEREGGSKLWLSPDKQRGLLQLVRDAEGMMHLQWKDRRTNAVGFVSRLPGRGPEAASLSAAGLFVPAGPFRLSGGGRVGILVAETVRRKANYPHAFQAGGCD